MSVDAYESAVDAVNSAELSATEYRAARRLLDLAHRETGIVRLDAETAMWACCVSSWDSVRRLLGALQGIDLIRYHAARDPARGVEIAWPVWGMVIHLGSPVIQNGSHSELDRALVECPACQTVIQIGSPVIQNGSHDGFRHESVIQNGSPVCENGSHGPPLPHTRIGLVGLDLDPESLLEDQEPNQTKPDPDARARLCGLLVEVGVSPPMAHRLSDMDVELGTRIVFAWLPEYDAGLAKVNLLVWRLQHRETAPPLRASDRASPLYRRHCAELALADALSDADKWKRVADQYSDIIIG